jgi:hypothetical protein
VPRKPKRARPKTREDRARVHEINRLLRTRGGLNPEDRTSLEAEKNLLSPVLELSRPDLEAWMGRIEAARESGSLSGVQGEKKEGISDRSPVSPQSNLATLVPGTFEHDAAIAWCSIPATPEVREAAVKRYWIEHGKRETERLLADPVRRRKNAALHVASTTDNPLRDHARKFAHSISYDENNLGTWGSVAERREHTFTGLLWEVLTWNRSFPHPTTEQKWSDAIFAEVDRRDLEDATWFRRVLETPRQSKPVEVKPEPKVPTVVSAEAKRVSPESEPTLNPIERASADLAARAALVLQTDSWLSRLAEHSPDMRTRILASLSDELLRVGFVSGDFCARLYNDSRPRALSQFPPRQF